MKTGIMIEANSKTDITLYTSTSMAGNYVLVLTSNGEDMTGTHLTNIKEAKGYIGHKSFTVGELTFQLQDLQYNERPDEEGKIGRASCRERVLW